MKCGLLELSRILREGRRIALRGQESAPPRGICPREQAVRKERERPMGRQARREFPSWRVSVDNFS
jgi:hypothetical protein